MKHARLVALGATILSLALSIAFHVQAPALKFTFALVFFCLCAGLMGIFVAVSVARRPWPKLPMAAGRVVAVLPAYNETTAVVHRTIESLLTGTVVPDVLHVIDDGSSTPVDPYDDPRVVWHRQENTGKRHAQVNALRGEHGDFLVTVDSDSIVGSNALEECLRAMSDEKVQAATVTVAVLNRAKNLLTRLTDLEIVYGCLVMRGVRSTFGAVAPTAGTFAMYRWDVFADNTADYVVSGTAGDDRRLTHYALLRGQVVAVENAVVETLMPETVKGIYTQRVRWFKSYFRYLPWELRHLSGAALIFRIWNLILLACYPTVIAWAVIVMPLTGHPFYWWTIVYWLGLMYCQTVRYVTYDRGSVSLRDRLITWLIGTPLLVPLTVFLLRPAMYAAIPQARTTHWATR